MRNRIHGNPSTTTRLVTAALCALSTALCVIPAAGAEFKPRTVLNPSRETLVKMQKAITVDLTGQRLEDAIRLVKELTGANIEPQWSDDQNAGLDKDKRITISVKNQPALSVIEKILDKMATDLAPTIWQMSDDGALQIGTKETLNKFKRVTVYDINDLLLQVRRFDQAATIDLQSALQQSQGGQGMSPIKEDNGSRDDRVGLTREELAKQIQEILISSIEPSQWMDNGGDAASIRYHNGTLIVNAPDYIHRQINGYSYWTAPASHSAGGGK